MPSIKSEEKKGTEKRHLHLFAFSFTATMRNGISRLYEWMRKKKLTEAFNSCKIQNLSKRIWYCVSYLEIWERKKWTIFCFRFHSGFSTSIPLFQCEIMRDFIERRKNWATAINCFAFSYGNLNEKCVIFLIKIHYWCDYVCSQQNYPPVECSCDGYTARASHCDNLPHTESDS